MSSVHCRNSLILKKEKDQQNMYTFTNTFDESFISRNKNHKSTINSSFVHEKDRDPGSTLLISAKENIHPNYENHKYLFSHNDSNTNIPAIKRNSKEKHNDTNKYHKVIFHKLGSTDERGDNDQNKKKEAEIKNKVPGIGTRNRKCKESENKSRLIHLKSSNANDANLSHTFISDRNAKDQKYISDKELKTIISKYRYNKVKKLEERSFLKIIKINDKSTSNNVSPSININKNFVVSKFDNEINNEANDLKVSQCTLNGASLVFDEPTINPIKINNIIVNQMKSNYHNNLSTQETNSKSSPIWKNNITSELYNLKFKNLKTTNEVKDNKYKTLDSCCLQTDINEDKNIKNIREEKYSDYEKKNKVIIEDGFQNSNSLLQKEKDDNTIKYKITDKNIQYKNQASNECESFKKTKSSAILISNNIKIFPKQDCKSARIEEFNIKYYKYEAKPQNVPEYFEEIKNHILNKQLLFLPSSDYMKSQNEITYKMRSLLVNWLVEVHFYFNLLPETLYITINLLDRFLSIKQIKKTNFQLLGSTCLYLASKYEEIYPPQIKDFIKISDNSFTKNEVIKMEFEVLSAINFNITQPSAFRLLEIIKFCLEIEEKTFYLACYILELTLLDYKMIKYDPILISSSVAYISLKIINRNISYKNNIIGLMNIDEEQLKSCSRDICFIMDGSLNSSFQAIKNKYQLPKYKEIARINFFENN